jgi:hypothetical protein
VQLPIHHVGALRLAGMSKRRMLWVKRGMATLQKMVAKEVSAWTLVEQPRARIKALFQFVQHAPRGCGGSSRARRAGRGSTPPPHRCCTAPHLPGSEREREQEKERERESCTVARAQQRRQRRLAGVLVERCTRRHRCARYALIQRVASRPWMLATCGAAKKVSTGPSRDTTCGKRKADHDRPNHTDTIRCCATVSAPAPSPTRPRPTSISSYWL